MMRTMNARQQCQGHQEECPRTYLKTIKKTKTEVKRTEVCTTTYRSSQTQMMKTKTGHMLQQQPIVSA
jgi:hypothetical protein